MDHGPCQKIQRREVAEAHDVDLLRGGGFDAVSVGDAERTGPPLHSHVDNRVFIIIIIIIYLFYLFIFFQTTTFHAPRLVLFLSLTHQLKKTPQYLSLNSSVSPFTHQLKKHVLASVEP